MRKYRYTMIVEIEYKFTFPGLEAGEHEVAYPKFEVTFDYIPATRAYTPRGEYAPIDPPDPAEVEFVSVKVIDTDGLTMSVDIAKDFVLNWLMDDEGYQQACDYAENQERE